MFNKIIFFVLVSLQCFCWAHNPQQPSKIAFLFLTYDDVYHQEYWRAFFSGHESYYSIYVHSKEPLPDNSNFKSFEIAVRVETTWENTMRAQIELLREALKDSTNEKFVFISDTTIPFHTFETTYEAFMSTSQSIFPFCLNPHQDPLRSGTFWGYHNYQPQKIFYPIPSEYQYKHPQWVILNRKHAELMAEDQEIIAIFDHYPCDQEHYPGTFLATKGLLHREVLNRQTTYDDWIATSSASNPFTFTDLHDEQQLRLAIKAITGKLYSHIHLYFFGRKFAKDCDLSPLNPYLPYFSAFQ